MKVLITGAHFTPAQAVIEEFKKRADVKLVYIGRAHTREGDKTPSVESGVITSLGVKFIPITSGRLQRRFTKYTIPSLLKIPIGFIQSFLILVKEKPDVVLSFGGYVAVPVVLSSWLLNIPIIVHEQTLVSGLANRICNVFADRIAVSFDKKYDFDLSKIVLTGNPIRTELFNRTIKLSQKYANIIKESSMSKLPVILIMGGNQGSHTLNEVIEYSLDELTKIGCIIHQTGDSGFKDYERLDDKKEQLKNPQRYLPTKWIEAGELGGILSKADLVVSRAGANTLLELAYFGVPTLLIPLPFGSYDEQNTNAKFFQKIGLAKVLPQSELKPEVLLENIKKMLKDSRDLKSSALEAKKIVIPDASKRLVQEVLILSERAQG